MENTKVCRLCLQNTIESVQLFGKLAEEMQIVSIISQHLWIEPKITDSFSNLICIICWTALEAFHKFYTNVKIAQSCLINPLDSCQEPRVNEIKVEIEDFKHEPQSDVVATEMIEVKKVEEILQQKKRKKADELENEIPVKGSSKSKPKENVSKKILENEETRNTKNARAPVSANEILRNRPKLPRETDAECNENDQKIRDFFKLQCDLCSNDEKFSKFSELRAHFRQVHLFSRGYVVCCSKHYRTRTDLLEHLSWHTNPEDFRCKDCGKVYSDKYHLKIHYLETHTSDTEKQFKCDICGLSYATYGRCSSHIITRHVAQYRKDYKCDKCDMTFVYPSLLKHHIRGTHESMCTGVCDNCGKKFRSKQSMIKHQIAEHGIGLKERIQCNVCSAWLKNKETLKSHTKRFHLDSKPATCNICGKISVNKPALATHMRYMHVFQRSHHCTVCNKAFKLQKKLKEHMTQHTGTSLYVCKFCPRTFNSSANKSTHQKRMHPDKWERDRRLRTLPAALRDSENDAFDNNVNV